ncbi:hypothetical protein GIB67_026735 [Kingdonia uniflora]|uniref:Uncharacterized protein n=1 Tax=Kingdonia uniflora TaxID=39325 RepID=A0A7J7MH86_9MAGN|nr:hypothetical protein GIB67_026735 [Kingdonia uniflora]
MADDEQIEKESMENRPGILMIGCPNVGKRTLLSRLLSVDFEGASDTSAETLCYGWTINTKYYTADVSVSMAHLDDVFSITTLPVFNKLAALVMVFDMNNLSSFATLRDWVSRTDIRNFDILLCIGNKADLFPGHFAHAEYRRLLQRGGESSSDPHPEFLDYGISQSEGSSLLGDEEDSSWELRRSCLEWCTQHNVEYIEACASNAEFDKCKTLLVNMKSITLEYHIYHRFSNGMSLEKCLPGLSVEGDSQGVERLYGALSAHMWPGMVLTSGNKIVEPYPLEKEELTEDESDFEIEYEILSAGSADAWDDSEVWVSADAPTTSYDASVPLEDHNQETEVNKNVGKPITSKNTELENPGMEVVEKNKEEPDKIAEVNENTHLGYEDLEHLMNEIGNVRGNLRLMPDFQRKEIAAKLAMKMAAMFGDSSGDEEEGFN